MKPLVWIAPLALAVLVALAQHAGYPTLMARATGMTRAWIPSDPAATAVDVHGTRLRVRGGQQPQFVEVPGIGWNLPVLICLWGWVVRRRWIWLLVASALLVLTHVLVADLAVRRALGDLVGFPHSLYRAWFIWLAPLLPVVFVALGRFAGAPPHREQAA